jgi:hypothetical protein
MTTTPQVSSGALYRNSGARSSGKTGPKSLTLAAEVARQVGMVPTWPNVQTIRLAIESEARYSELSISQSAALIVSAANDFTIVCAEDYNFQAATLLRKSNVVNRFWFEDALWRYKTAYQNMLARLQRESA